MATTTARPAALVHPKPNEAGASDALTPEDRTSLLRHMLLMRATEERALTLYRQGKVPGSYYTVADRRRYPSAARSRSARATARASCTATSAPTSCAASGRGACSPR